MHLKAGSTYGFEYVVALDLSKKRTSLLGSEIKPGSARCAATGDGKKLAAIRKK